MKKAKVLLVFFIIWAWVMPLAGFASGLSPLPADQAFVFSVTVDHPNQVTVKWQIAEGYYLYAKRIHISVDPKTTADIRMPQGDFKYDLNNERYEAFSGLLAIPVLLQTSEKQLQLKVNYQGCSQSGFCYPPMQKDIMLNLANLTATPIDKSQVTEAPLTSTFKSLLTNQNDIHLLLQSQHFSAMLLIFLGLGLLLAFTPCVLPMIPILTSIIVGHKQAMSTKKAFLLSTSYVLGTAITYALAGMLAAAAGNSLQVWLQKPWIIAAMSGLFVLLAFSLFGFYDLRLPRRLQNCLTLLSNQQKSGTYAGVFLMGMLSTLIVSPCVTAPLVGVLMYIGKTGNLLFGASALFAMGIGMGIPLLLIGASAGKWLPKSGPWMEAVKKIFGLLMLGMAIWLLSRVVAPDVAIRIWGLLLLGIALFFGLHLPRLIGRHGLNRGLGFVVGCSGMLLMIGGTEPMLISQWMNLSQYTTPSSHAFIVVRDSVDLDKQLLIAKAAHRPVILDFYADWCESCVSMDRHVFNAPEIKQALSNYVLLRADLSQNTANDEALLKRFNVIAPPTVLFFGPNGHEANSERIVGEVDAKEFLGRLNVFMAASCDKNVQC